MNIRNKKTQGHKSKKQKKTRKAVLKTVAYRGLLPPSGIKHTEGVLP
jgi:hypothetical protein